MACQHKTAMVIHRNEQHTYMQCTGSCRQPYVMERQADGTYTEATPVEYYTRQNQPDEVQHGQKAKV